MFLEHRDWSWWSAAAAVACVAGAVLAWQLWAPRATVSVLQLQKAPIHTAVQTDLVWRGSTPSEAEHLRRALEPYEADDFAEASRRLTAVVSRYPRSAAGHFYLGVSELFLGHDAEAVSALESAERAGRDEPQLAAETAWYLALAYARMGQIERAGGKLDVLCRGESSRAASACAGLRELAAESSVPLRR